MKLFHLSDLHLGKRLNEYPLRDDQHYILKQVLKMMDAEKPDALIIAGDVYDKSVPPADAVTLFDDFLFELAQRQMPTLIVSGNHDSPERLSFGSRLMEHEQIYMSRVFDGHTTKVSFNGWPKRCAGIKGPRRRQPSPPTQTPSAPPYATWTSTNPRETSWSPTSS